MTVCLAFNPLTLLLLFEQFVGWGSLHTGTVPVIMTAYTAPSVMNEYFRRDIDVQGQFLIRINV